jgi:hypothetical protein
VSFHEDAIKPNRNILSKGIYKPASTSASTTAPSPDGEISFRMLDIDDPNEYGMSVGVQIARGAANSSAAAGGEEGQGGHDVQINVDFAYWTDALQAGKARSVAKAFRNCAVALIENGSSGFRVWMLQRRLQ